MASSSSSPTSSMHGVHQDFWPPTSNHPYRTAVHDRSESSLTISMSRNAHARHQESDSQSFLPDTPGLADGNNYHEPSLAYLRSQPQQAMHAQAHVHAPSAAGHHLWTRTPSESSASSHSYYSSGSLSYSNPQDAPAAAGVGPGPRPVYDSGINEAGWSKQPMMSAGSSAARMHRQEGNSGDGSDSYTSSRQPSPTRQRSSSFTSPFGQMMVPSTSKDAVDRAHDHLQQRTTRPGTTDGLRTYGQSSQNEDGRIPASSINGRSSTPNMKASSSRVVMDGSSSSPSTSGNSRNFLIPISGTGARQKLSILSASQRPRTSQSQHGISAEGILSLTATSRIHPQMTSTAPDDDRSAMSAHDPDCDFPRGRDLGWDNDNHTPRRNFQLLSPTRQSFDVDDTRGIAVYSPHMSSTAGAPDRSFEMPASPKKTDQESQKRFMTWNGRPPLRTAASDYNLLASSGEWNPALPSNMGPLSKYRGLPRDAGPHPSSDFSRASMQTPQTISQAAPNRPGNWKAGIRNIFSKSAKEQSRSQATEDSMLHSKNGSYERKEHESIARASATARLSPSSKAYAILGEIPAANDFAEDNSRTEQQGRGDHSLRNEADEIAKAGWTTYRARNSNDQRKYSPSAEPSMSQDQSGRGRAISVSSAGERYNTSAVPAQHSPSFFPSAQSSRGLHPSSSRSQGDSWSSNSSNTGSWSQSSAYSRGTPTPDMEGSPSDKDGSPIRKPVSARSYSRIPMSSNPLALSSDASASSDEGDETRSKTPVPLLTDSDSVGTVQAPSDRQRIVSDGSDWSMTSANAAMHHRTGSAVPPRKASSSTITNTQRHEQNNKDTTPRPASNMSLRSLGDVPAPAERAAVPLTSPLLASILTRPPYEDTQSTGRQTTNSQTMSNAAPKPPRLDSSKSAPRVAPKSAQRLETSKSSVDTQANGNEPEHEAKHTSAPAALAPERIESKSVDPQTFVPADAFKLTRKGIAVQPARGLSDGLQSAATAMSETKSSASISDNEKLKKISDLPDEGKSMDRLGSRHAGDHENSYTFDDDTSVDAVNLLPASAWTEVDTALLRFKAIPSQSASDKGALLRSVLLPFLALEAETPDVEVSGAGPFRDGKARRRLFFDWIRNLLIELRSIQTSADRGAILESIACIIESRNFSTAIISKDVEDQSAFYNALTHIISYAIGELNKKGVYQNTLIFSGRLLAIAFFRIEGVASKLLRSLPVNRFALARVATEVDWEKNRPKNFVSFRKRFPAWLQEFCFDSARQYLKTLDSQSGRNEEEDRFLVRQASIEVEMSGNWLRRWQSDDSELFFSFCRSYHRQLSLLFSLQQRSTSSSSERRLFFGGPGYAHLSTCIHQKCLSLVHRDILSVTTLSSQKNFNPGETANVLSGSTAGKPRHLEAANRRCTAIVVDIIRSTPVASTESSIFAPMLELHVKCLVKRTSLFDVQGVFCLLDWLDGVLTHMENAEMSIGSYIDVSFLLDTIWLLLKDADHALALMRTIAFCYSNFAILTSTSEYRARFLEKILLNPIIFKKLFLSWSFTIRAYFLHLLVFRLARINDFDNPPDDSKGKSTIRVVRLLNQRLDEIRRRHDELSPQPSADSSHSGQEDEIARNRRASFVSTIRRTPSVHQVELSPASATKAERILGIGTPDPALTGSPNARGSEKVQSRAAKWLRVLGGSKGAKSGRKEGEAMQLGASTPGLGLYTEGSNGSASGSVHETHLRESMEKKALMGRLDELDTSGESAHEPTASSDDSQGDDEPLGNLQASLRNSQSIAGVTSESKISAPAGEHLSDDVSFDLQNASAIQPPISTGGGLDSPGTEHGPSRIAPHSPQRISRAFSRRRSMLPRHAMSFVTGEDASGKPDADLADGSTEVPIAEGESTQDTDVVCHRTRKHKQTSPTDAVSSPSNGESADAVAYDRTLHIYAVQSLREYEQTVQEHDEFFASQPANAGTPQVPRLPIQWPAMWSE